MTEPPSRGPRAVSRFEADLLRILHFFLRRDPAAHALPLVWKKAEEPPCLSRDAVELVKDALRKGCVHLLAHTSGWRRERFLRSGKAALGRLWERTPPDGLALSFSAHTMRFLIRVTAEDPRDRKTDGWPDPPRAGLTPGDLLLYYLVYSALRDTDAAPAMQARSLFAGHGLVRLAFPEDFTAAGLEVAPDLLPWTTGVGACMLESLQRELAARWRRLERDKGTMTDWQRLRAVGQSQECVLAAFFDAVESAGRRDLARFLLDVLADVLPEGIGPDPRPWVGGLTTAGPRLADRAETSRAALALLRVAERFRRWQHEARGLRFFDDEYEAGQLWLADWDDRQGEQLHSRAEAILREAEPMRAREEPS